ncbi:hypothetical protein [Arenibacterium sp. LLYu02]|uniref:hypothetical protein n=1 Tax=Arenibacterium sp. LLYu02 TaxID=3404132 RepID=UPI003B20C123
MTGISTTAAYALNAEHYLKLMQSAVPQAQVTGDVRGSEAMTDRASRYEAGSANSVLSIYHKPTATTPVPQLTQLTEQLMEIRRGALGDTRQAVADALGGVLGREVRMDTTITEELSLYDRDQLRAAGKGGLIDARREVDLLNSAMNTLGSTTYLSFMQLDEQESQMTEDELFVHVATEAAHKKINKIDRLLQHIEKPTVTDDMVANAGLGEVHDQIRDVLSNWHDLDKDALAQEMIPGFVERMKSGDWGIAIKGDWARADTATVIGRYHMEEAVWRNPEEAERMRRSAEIAKANGGSGIYYQMRLDDGSIASASVARFFQTSATV